MPIIKFTDRKVKSLKSPPPNQQTDYWNKTLGRFGLRVSWTGKKSWVVLYRHHHRSRRLTLGSYPAMSLAAATIRAKEALIAVDSGRDPAAERSAAENAKTFAELCDEYIERHAKPKKKTWKEDKRIIGRDLLPRWRHSTPAEITRSDVRAVVEAVYDRGAHVHANRVLALIRKIFNFAIEREWLEHNPCNQVKPPGGRERPRDRVLSDEESRTVWAAFDAEEPAIRAVFKLRLLTAQRGGEVLSMRWEDVDLESGWWTIPADRAKNGLSHRVPLNAQALAILRDLRSWQEKRLPEINEGRAKKHEEPKTMSEWVFPSPRNEAPVAWIQKATKRIRDASGVDFLPHDLRRTAASRMTGSGTPRLVVSKILNHVEQGVTAVYDRHSYDAEKRRALNAWGRQLQRILTATKDEKVVSIAAGRAV